MKKMIMVILGIGLLLGTIACNQAVEGEGDTVNASMVIDHLINEGLEAVDSRDMNQKDYGPLPMVATSAQVFKLPTIGEGITGHVFVFENQEDMNKVKEVYQQYAAMVPVWLFDHGNVLLHLSGQVDEENAIDYEEALIRL